MKGLGRGVWHLLAILTVTFWGTSFVSTKVLLSYGFSAIFIFFVRFVTTYLLLLLCSHQRMRAESWRDELRLLVGGMAGGTLYFWLENTALTISPSSNVSLIVCTNPLMILVVVSLLYKKERLGVRQVIGSLITFVGMVLVVLNGQLLGLSPVGDLMALGAAVVWAVYSVIIRDLYDHYSTLFITRKVFFYSCLTTIPILLYDGSAVPWENFSESAVILNFLLLTMFSSLFGYLVWNKVLKQLGTVLASNYIYVVPLVTMITAVIVLDERITGVAIAGAAAIVVGMVMAEYKA